MNHHEVSEAVVRFDLPLEHDNRHPHVLCVRKPDQDRSLGPARKSKCPWGVNLSVEQAERVGS